LLLVVVVVREQLVQMEVQVQQTQVKVGLVFHQVSAELPLFIRVVEVVVLLQMKLVQLTEAGLGAMVEEVREVAEVVVQLIMRLLVQLILAVVEEEVVVILQTQQRVVQVL
jgi:hypothetical protein